ncbi:MAG TPA: glycosyltransferase family 1 protein [Bacteroidetes bacterium]|nr:glycosyltransferase family 1 protein [Bacteroidota bacterium]HEX03806.1 glycosyltransferase family 1 protein [Bacteroidota bacterium]
MNISFVNFASDWGGGEGWTLRTALGLSERGHVVNIVARNGSPFAQQASSSPLPTLTLPISYDYRPGTVFALRRHLLATGCNVVVVHHNKDVRTAGVAAKMIGVPVVHRNGFPVVKDTGRHRITMRFTDRILTNSTRIRDTYQALNWLKAKPMDVVANGIDVSSIPARDPELTASLGFSDNALIALFAGRLTGVKRVDILLRAFEALDDSSRWRLVIAGEGGQRSKLEALTDKLGLSERVHFLGYRDDARALAACADLGVLPSRDEGMPNSLMEAMAAGTAVTATPAGDVELLLDHGNAGWIMPMGEVRPWTALLNELEADPDRLQRMSVAGRERVLENFTFERMIDGVENSLKRAIMM